MTKGLAICTAQDKNRCLEKHIVFLKQPSLHCQTMFKRKELQSQPSPVPKKNLKQNKQIIFVCFIFLKKQVWPNLIKSDQIWSNLIKSDQIWVLIKFDQIWSDLIRFDQVQNFLFVFPFFLFQKIKGCECLVFVLKTCLKMKNNVWKKIIDYKHLKKYILNDKLKNFEK